MSFSVFAIYKCFPEIPTYLIAAEVFTISVQYRIYTEMDCAIRLTQFVVKSNRPERILSKSETYFVLQNFVFYAVGQMRTNLQLYRKF